MVSGVLFLGWTLILVDLRGKKMGFQHELLTGKNWTILDMGMRQN
jgi:hypothetical protein